MIASLEGIVDEYETEAVILNVGGVGYCVYASRVTAEPGERIKLYISEVIREDKHDLYGFMSKDEREMFLLFTNVQGVGPKSCQKILNAASANDLRKHIQNSNLDFFTSISGVGKKTAQKIILDLRGILVDQVGDEKIVRDDVTDALESLGYDKADIQAVLPYVTGETSAERVKSALKFIGGKR